MKKKKFSNPYIDDTKRTFFKFLLWRFSKKRGKQKRKKETIPQQKADLEAIYHPGKSPQVTWIGHSTLLIQYKGYNILTDPVLSSRCSPFPFLGPRRLTPPAIALKELPPIDLVVISHNHYDHLDRKTVSYLGNKPLWLVPLGLKRWFLKRKIHHLKELDWWGEQQFEKIQATCTPSQHWSKRTPFDDYKTLWSSWVLNIEKFRFFFAGDTGYNAHQFKEIGKHLGPFDLAAIPIGAYEPRWFMQDYHVNPEEAVKIHQDIHASLSIGIHYGTFQLADDQIGDPVKHLKEAKKKHSVKDNAFISIPIGKTIKIPFKR